MKKTSGRRFMRFLILKFRECEICMDSEQNLQKKIVRTRSSVAAASWMSNVKNQDLRLARFITCNEIEADKDDNHERKQGEQSTQIM